MSKKVIVALVLGALVMSLFAVLPASANPPSPDGFGSPAPRPVDLTAKPAPNIGKTIDQPNPIDKARIEKRRQLLESGNVAEAQALGQTGTDRVLVILVEFAGTDTFTWEAGKSTWDPYGIVDPNEAVLDENGAIVLGDCSKIITETKTFTYGPTLHNQMPRPLSATDRSGDTIWTEDFSTDWFKSFMFGNGIKFQYTRQDGSKVDEDFTGKSVKNYFLEMSNGTYTINGDVIGWVQVPHSTWYYDADQCPGGRSAFSGSSGARRGGLIPGAGSARTLVRDSLDAVNAISNTIPGFDWKNYDLNGDGIIDRLWIVHSGYGEEDGPPLLNRTDYGEAAVWSHSSSVTPPYKVSEDIAAGAYIVMPENGGIGVFAHEYAHNLGADDLYAYGDGETSTGFWALQADDWTGFPIGYEPPAPDPWHLDNWGWLNPLVVDDPSKEYVVKIGQASNFPNQPDMVRGVKIALPTGYSPLPVAPKGHYGWWGGAENQANGMMTLKNALAVPAAGAQLQFDIAYGIETQWDFLWVQASDDGGATWKTLTNANTQCEHDPSWIGEEYGFPADLCAAGIGGLTDYNASFPDYDTETFDLAAFAGKNVLLRLWYMTDWGTVYEGPFVDNVKVTSGSATLFSDDAEAGDANWTYAAPWIRTDGRLSFNHNYYLQWRNVNKNGGYDESLGDARWRFGPANTGLLVWYNNNFYADNEIFNHLTDFPGFGPKGRMLVVDSHPEPYRDPEWVAKGYDNEFGNIASRGQMRDAPFTLADTVPFDHTDPYRVGATKHSYPGRPAVSVFDDRFGWYPGAEKVAASPYGQTSPRWMTKQWDASAVIPSKTFYGVKAPGLAPNERFRFGCNLSPLNAAGQVLCYGFGAGLGYAGGTGNPIDTALSAPYGWRVQILEEAADHTWAKVRIYNRTTAVMEVAPTAKGAGYFDSMYQWQSLLTGANLYAGLDTRPQTPRTLYGAFQFDVSGLPANATLLDAKVTLTGRSDAYMNAKGSGAWSLQMLGPEADRSLGSLSVYQFAHASAVATIGPKLQDSDLAPDKPNVFGFNATGLAALQAKLTGSGKATFRINPELNAPFGRNIFAWNAAGPQAPVLWVKYEY